MILQGYHGAPQAFKMFDFSKTATNGAEHGSGFYITSNKQVAKAYGNTILKVNFEVNAPFSNDKITITKKQLHKFIKNFVDPKGNILLDNFNDVIYYGYNKVLNDAIDSYFLYNNNDVDILSEVLTYIASRTNNANKIFDNIYNIFKKDFFYYEQMGEDGETIKNYIILSNKQILNIKED